MCMFYSCALCKEFKEVTSLVLLLEWQCEVLSMTPAGRSGFERTNESWCE
jgi:hypothetical protein